MTAVLYAIRRADGQYYTHGYPGSWDVFPRLQAYQTKGSATRQLNKLLEEGAEVVPVTLSEGDTQAHEPH